LYPSKARAHRCSWRQLHTPAGSRLGKWDSLLAERRNDGRVKTVVRRLGLPRRRWVGSPNSKPHLAGARRAFENADLSVARFRNWVEACNTHFVTAMTSGQFSGSRHQQTLNHRHRIYLKPPSSRCIAAIIAVRRKRKLTLSLRLDATFHASAGIRATGLGRG
jgi:hypothetical protein